MAVPSAITDLSTTANSNSPAGSDSVGNPGTIDDYFRAYAAIHRAESLNKAWERWNDTPTYVSATQFTVTGDKTSRYVVGRRVKCTVTAGTVYGRITVSAYTTLTTVTVVLDSGNLDSGLSEVQLGPETYAFPTNSAGLAALLSDETGSGAAVFATSPTLTTPNIGAATGTSAALTSTSAGAETLPFRAINANAANQDTAVGYAFRPHDSSDTAKIVNKRVNQASSLYDLIFYVFDGSGLNEKLRITASGNLYGTALHNNGTSPTGATNQYIASGTYTPTVTAGTNVSGSSGPTAMWSRVGNVITVSGRVAITTTAAGSSKYDLSLPIASNLSTEGDLAGVARSNRKAADETGGAIFGDATNDRATVEFYTDTSGVPLVHSFTFQYVVL